MVFYMLILSTTKNRYGVLKRIKNKNELSDKYIFLGVIQNFNERLFLNYTNEIENALAECDEQVLNSIAHFRIKSRVNSPDKICFLIL